jgi:hypothetical protein
MTIYIYKANFPSGARLPPDPPAGGIAPSDPTEGVPPSAIPRVEECTYFWGVNTSWGINTTESKRPLNQEDNQAPQPTQEASGKGTQIGFWVLNSV